MTNGVKLPYGKAADGRLVHISEVATGLACNCVCPKCERKLVAKKGPRNIHHFSHHAETASCKKAYETMLHLLAKQLIVERKIVWMPPGEYEHRGRRYTAFDRMPFRPTSVSLEFWMDGIRPDIVARNEPRSKELLVEIYVTHRCEPKKIALIRDRKIAAIEIDLSKLSRCAPKDEIEEAILSSAERTWLFNPRIEKAQHERRARDEREEKEAKAREKRRIEREAMRLVAVLRDARRKRIASPDAKTKKLMVEVSDAGLSKFVGIADADSDCFSVTSNIWQAAVIHQFVTRESWVRHFSLHEVRNFLRASGFLFPDFSGQSDPKITKAIRGSDPGFLAPGDAIHRYLVSLRSHHLIEYDNDDGNAVRLFQITNSAQSKINAAKEHRTRVESIMTKLDGLMARLPSGGGVDADQWMRRVHAGYSNSPFELARNYGDYYRLIDHLSRLERMLSVGPNVEENLLGLPMEEHLKARKEDQRRADEEAQRLAVEQAQREAEKARMAALQRKNELVYEAISDLGSGNGKSWLASSLPALGGKSVESMSGLSVSEFYSALAELRPKVAQQTREARQRELLKLLHNEVTASRGVEWADLWMKQASPFLGNRKPIDVCVDERGLEECRYALKQVNRRPRYR